MKLKFEEFKKIDAHVHFNNETGAVASLGEQFNFDFLSINTNVPFFPPIKKQEEIVLQLRDKYGGRIAYLSTFPVHNWNDEYWSEQTIEGIRQGLGKGARGVKIWKNIGMELKDKNDAFVMIDHPQLDPIFNFLEENNLPFLGHQGEPKNCWLPIEKMTVKQDQQYFEEHPEYHMHLHPEYPSYESHIQARDKRCGQHPKLRFVAAHIASLEWSIEEAGLRLDTYPNMQIDLADRVCHLQYQAITKWEKVRQFFIDYQDRIIYGTDVIEGPDTDADEIKTIIIERWKKHWQFFTSDDRMTTPKVYGTFNGLALPNEVIEKIYYQNAYKSYFNQE